MEVDVVSLSSEFPNDNPALHRGTIWVCLEPTGRPQPERSSCDRDLESALEGAADATSVALEPTAIAFGDPPIEPTPALELELDNPLEDIDAGSIVVEELELLDVSVEGTRDIEDLVMSVSATVCEVETPSVGIDALLAMTVEPPTVEMAAAVVAALVDESSLEAAPVVDESTPATIQAHRPVDTDAEPMTVASVPEPEGSEIVIEAAPATIVMKEPVMKEPVINEPVINEPVRNAEAALEPSLSESADDGVRPTFEEVPETPIVTHDSSALPPAPDDPFTVLVCMLADVAIQAGSPNVASLLPGLLFDGRLPDTIDADVLDALRAAGLWDGREIAGTFVTTTCAWRAILRGTSDDFDACGAAMLDEWASDLLAKLLNSPAKATTLRQELRSRGVAAFGLAA
jgi:hypothetical protein